MSYNQSNRKKAHKYRYIPSDWQITENILKYFASLLTHNSRRCYTKSLETSVLYYHAPKVSWSYFQLSRERRFSELLLFR